MANRKLKRGLRARLNGELIMKRCAYCFSEEKLTIDHIIPKIKGGTDDIKNLQCLCHRCNWQKSDLTHGQLIQAWILLLRIDETRKSLDKRSLSDCLKSIYKIDVDKSS